MTGFAPRTAEQWRSFCDYYYNCIQSCDNQLKIILDLLEKKDLLGNTIIVFTSDHGEMMGAHDPKEKVGFVYEGNVHVSLVIYHPEYSCGRTCSAITSHIDLAPTFVAMTDVANKTSVTGDVKGYRMLPLLKNPFQKFRNDTDAPFLFEMISMIDGDFAIYPYRIDIENRGFLRGIITNDYKFARYFSPIGFNTPTALDSLYDNNDLEMFAIGTDEMTNLAFPRKNVEANPAHVMMTNQKLKILFVLRLVAIQGRKRMLM